MTTPLKVLLLAGSSEARQIAAALAAQGHAVRALKSEPPRGPETMPVPFELVDQVTPERMQSAVATADVVVDASHGFDAVMTDTGYQTAQMAGVPYIHFQRAPWDVSEDPHWRRAADVRAAMDLIPPKARVFSATGWASLPEYAGFPGSCLMLRQTTRHDRPAPFPFVELVFGDPPFSAADEEALFKVRRVDLLICRNLGGPASRPKLEAARTLELDVILIDRPLLPEGLPLLDSIEAVLEWVAGC